MRPSLLLSMAAAAVLAMGAVGCASGSDENVAEAADEALVNAAVTQWVYDGPLPALASPEITVSLAGKTVRVSGGLPAGFTGQLPFYAKQSGSKVAVVYPVAIAEGSERAGDFKVDSAIPTPDAKSTVVWGGYPVLMTGGAPAFHGPLTASDALANLTRGVAGAGMNRMFGEHLVEIAALVGIDMTASQWDTNKVTATDVRVTVIAGLDTWDGKAVDVNYTADAKVLAVTDAAADKVVFPTWLPSQLPAMVCRFKGDYAPGETEIATDYCSRKHKNLFDPIAGPHTADDGTLESAN